MISKSVQRRNAHMEKVKMGTCKNCRWWRKLQEMGDCNAHSKTERVSAHGGWTDGGEWKENIVTGPDFGCIHFKAVPINKVK